MNKKAKIYITGHQGMVGGNLLELLYKKGFSNIITRTSKELDLRNAQSVDSFFKYEKPDYVFHLAARVGGIMANIQSPAEFLYDNVMISSNIIESSRRHSVKKLLNFGSSCMYPRECPQPMKEEYLLSGKLEPTNEGYALAKILSVKLCESYHRQYGCDFISLVPCNLYGVYERFDPVHSHVISGLIMKMHEAKMANTPSLTLWGTGEARREFLFANDAARAAYYFMQNYSAKDLGNNLVNVGSGFDVPIKELAEIIRTVVQYKGTLSWDPLKPDGMPQKLMDISRMKSFKFKPLISLEKGVQLTYDYYLNTYALSKSS